MFHLDQLSLVTLFRLEPLLVLDQLAREATAQEHPQHRSHVQMDSHCLLVHLAQARTVKLTVFLMLLVNILEASPPAWRHVLLVAIVQTAPVQIQFRHHRVHSLEQKD